MNGALFIFKKAADDAIALFGKDLSAIDASDQAVTLYFNSQDSSGADVNSVALTVKDGKENQVVQLLGELARAEGTVVFDDEVAGNDFPSDNITAISSIQLNGVPGGSVFASQAVESITASKTLKDSDAGKIFLLDNASGLTVTMPDSDAAAVGQVYTFLVKTAISSGTYKIGLDSGDFYRGLATGGVGTANGKAANGTSNDFINLNGGTSGGLGGDIIKLVYTDAGFVFCDAIVNHSGTLGAVFADS